MPSAGVIDGFVGKRNWFELSCKELAKTFSDGVKFVVVMPAVQTLRQQTFDRIVKAKLADIGVVIPTIWSSKVSSSEGIQKQPGHVSHVDRLRTCVLEPESLINAY